MPGSTSRLSAAVTRTGPVRARLGHLLAPQQVVVSPETFLRYRIDRLIGEGGFGQVYLARRLGRSQRRSAASLCIKASRRIDGWLREAYFGQVLDGQPRAIRVYDAFPLPTKDGLVYCLALEYASLGDLRAFLHRTRAAGRRRRRAARSPASWRC